MEYIKKDMGAYNLHIIKTNKFKTITVEVNFRRKLEKDDITIRNILKSVLLSTNAYNRTERELVKETENLYDLKLLSSNMRIGNMFNTSFKIRFLNEKYTEEGMNRESINFLMDILFNPDIEDGKFNSEIVDKCKNKLKKQIDKLKDDKLRYTLFKLMASVKDKPYSYNSFGDVKELEKINAKNLYDYYMDMFNNDLVDIFVVGDLSVDMVKDLFRERFMINRFKKNTNNIIVDEISCKGHIKNYEEEIDASGSQLTLLCGINGLNDFERRYTLSVYNELLGGSSNAILFNTVREKYSYAYYINSNSKAYDNILFIYAGIDNKNKNNVIKLIKKGMKDINCGRFDDKLLFSAKETIIASILASMDTPNGIINTYYAHELVNSDLPDERIDNIKKITREDIINISKKIKINTIYTLVGKREDSYEGD